MIGKTLSHFRITAKLGEGGMGEVYRAEDTKLGREVAIKVLPEAVAGDPERLARFQREAQVLASLNHPNIAAIYQVERAGDSHFLVMELVDGQTLAEWIDRGAIPVEEVLPIALEITAALENAHDQGIIHRDLKPANVKVTSGGHVKVLDFGLAKALEPDATQPRADLSLSPTLTAQMTQAGVLLGTAAYMSPEQARGQEADRRSDIWSFGVVLTELLTGTRPFAGDTVSDSLAAVLRAEVDWTELPDECPQSIRRLLRRCLERDPSKRLHDIADVRLEIEEALSGAEEGSWGQEPTVAKSPALWVRLLPWGLVAVLLAATAILAMRGTSPVERASPSLHASINPPAGGAFDLESSGPAAPVLSPDGTRLMFGARDAEGRARLYIRALDEPEARLLAGTDDAVYPFWSADGRWIGYFHGGNLIKMEAGGGPAQPLCAARLGKGGAWSPGNEIVFAPDWTTPIFRVSADGGEPIAVTDLETAGHMSHRHPRFLPDGRHFLYLARSADGNHAVMVGSVDGDVSKLVVHSPAAAEFAEGHLLYLRERSLLAQPFDLDRLELTGDPVVFAEEVTLIGGSSLSLFSVSANGLLIYRSGGDVGLKSLEWLDRAGQPLGMVGVPLDFSRFEISPNEKSVLLTIVEIATGAENLWLHDLERGVQTRLTFHERDELHPAWMPDGESVLFSSDRSGVYDLYRKSLRGRGEAELLLESQHNKFSPIVSPDGGYLAFYQRSEDTAGDVWSLPLAGGDPTAILQTRFDEFPVAFSPAGRWMAYLSNESGQLELYVTPFPEADQRWQISPDGAIGDKALWIRGGRELVYLDRASRLTAVEVELRDDGIRVGRAESLFACADCWWFDAPDDGERFLITRETFDYAQSVNLVVNWTSRLE